MRVPSTEAWHATPLEVRSYVWSVEGELGRTRAALELAERLHADERRRLERALADRDRQNRRLADPLALAAERAALSSRTSSKPPSSDPPSAPKRPPRRRGGARRSSRRGPPGSRKARVCGGRRATRGAGRRGASISCDAKIESSRGARSHSGGIWRAQRVLTREVERPLRYRLSVCLTACPGLLIVR